MSEAFLKCDAPGCDHVETVDAISRDLIGKPCAKCGANLLSEKDFADWQLLVQPGIDLMKELGLFVDTAPDEQDVARVFVHLHDETLSLGPVKSGGAE